MKRFFWALVALCVAAGVYLAVISAGDKEISAQTVSVKEQVIEQTVELSGTVRPRTSVVVSALEGGIISELLISDGSKVAPGDVIARMYDGGASAALTAIDEWEQSVAVSSAAYQTPDIESLLKLAQTSSLELGSLGAAVALCQSSVPVNAQYFPDEKLSEIKAAADSSVITAPSGGTVTALNAAAGQGVAAGTALAVISDLDSLLISCRVGESDIAKLSRGMSVRIISREDGSVYTGKITSVSSAASPASASSPAACEVTVTPDQSFSGTAGLSADVIIPYSRKSSALCIPVSALVSGDSVYKLDENGVARLTRITAGVSSGNYVQILSGLSAGDTVVIPTDGLEDGMKVAVS